MNKVEKTLTLFESLCDHLNKHKGITNIYIDYRDGYITVTFYKQNCRRGFEVSTRYSNWLEEAMLAFDQQCQKLEKDCEQELRNLRGVKNDETINW